MLKINPSTIFFKIVRLINEVMLSSELLRLWEVGALRER